MLPQPMPTPSDRLNILAMRLASYSIAINALARVQTANMRQPGDKVPDDEMRLHTTFEELRQTYYDFREEFDKLRADHSQQFTTWYMGVLEDADARFTGNMQVADVPAAKAWGGKVPEWADDARLAAQADAEAAKALEAAIGG